MLLKASVDSEIKILLWIRCINRKKRLIEDERKGEAQRSHTVTPKAGEFVVLA